ncbi:acyltransferase family protein [Falsirhodobacter deserti]|uniref:acyltransferase family protein n=1 Tax=Falsirhodobacter deserti TaxID=1365611 RepID=UPI000FE3A658|nr:acyltransferase family protein [Falsirhodobacter deserti]
MDRVTSDAIRITRVLCILCMSYVHLHFFDLPGTDFTAIRAIVVDTLGRSSVPLLSVISGFLMVGFFSKRDYREAATQRARALIVPMIIWNSIAVMLWGWSGLNDILGLTETSKLIYLTFLRDLFVMSLMTPLLLFLARKLPALLFAGAAVVYVADISSILVLRPQILFFYCMGVLIAVNPIKMPAGWKVFAIAALAALCILIASFPQLTLNDYFDNLIRRPVTSLGFWAIALILAERAARLSNLDRFAFPFFLSHGIMFYYVGALYADVEFLQFPAAYLVIWLCVPILCFAFIMGIWNRTGRFGKLITG